MGRALRKKFTDRGAYFHLYNRVCGPIGDLPFEDVDKEKAILMLQDLSNFFMIEVISACIMSNHIHILTHVEGKPPSLEEATKRYNAYYGSRRASLDPSINPEGCEKVARQMVDISEFMRRFQQQFTLYFNKVHKRRGALWAGRFKSTILEGSREALWNGVKYVELNPVRAGIVDDPAGYRFCTWGRFCGSGKHPFHANFCKHMRAVAEQHSGEMLSDEQVIAEFRGELARIRAWESNQDDTLDKDGRSKAEVAAETARTKGDSMPVRFLRRTRYWTDGAIIGSKAFVQEVACQFEDADNHARLLKKQLSRGSTPGGGVLHCFKRLREEHA